MNISAKTFTAMIKSSTEYQHQNSKWHFVTFQTASQFEAQSWIIFHAIHDFENSFGVIKSSQKSIYSSQVVGSVHNKKGVTLTFVRLG